MPIRHCQNCGIKIIVDDDKATVFPFYCDLCHTKSAMVSSVKTGGEPLQAAETKVDASLQKKSESVCPNCNLILTIKVAEKPIKSRCPECSRDILLLPDGSVRLIEDPDLLKFARQPEAKSGSSQSLKPAVAPKPASSASLKPAPKAQVPTSTSKSTPAAKKVDPVPRIVVKMPDSKVVTKTPPAKPAPTPKPMPKPEGKVETPKAEAKAPEPAAASSGTSVDSPAKTPGLLRPATRRFRASADLPTAKKANPILVTSLVLLPVVVGIAAYFVATDGAMKQSLEDLGLVVRKGAKKIFEAMTPRDTPAPPPTRKTEAKSEEKPFTEDEKASLRALILDEYRKALGAWLTYWRDESEPMRAAAESAEKNVQDLKTEYRRRASEEPNIIEGEKAAFEDFLLKLHQLKLQTRQRMRRVADPSLLQKKIEMLSEKWNEFTAKYEQRYGRKYTIPDEFASQERDPRVEDKENLDALYRELVEKERQLQKEGENAAEITRNLYESARRKFEEAKKAYEERYKEAYEPPK